MVLQFQKGVQFLLALQQGGLLGAHTSRCLQFVPETHIATTALRSQWPVAGTREEHRLSPVLLLAPSPALPVRLGAGQTQTGFPLGLCFGKTVELASGKGDPCWSKGSTALQKTASVQQGGKGRVSCILALCLVSDANLSSYQDK